MDEIIAIINTVGFPIGMCIYAMYIMSTTLSKISEQVKIFQTEQQEFTRSINNLTEKQQQTTESIRILVESIKLFLEKKVA